MSDYGARTISANNGRQIDNKFMVPQLIGKVYAGDYPYYDTPLSNGWVYRTWQITIPAAATSRPYVRFFGVPSATREVYYSGASCIYSPGAIVDPPWIYYFAVDYVSLGNERYGRRVFNAAGQVLYDSGNTHLNIDQTLTGLNPDMGWSNHDASFGLSGWATPKGTYPAAPALSADTTELTNEWGNKVETGLARARLFYRLVNGNALHSIFCRYEYTVDYETTTLNPYDRVYRSPGLNQTVMIIDRYQHDV